MESWEESGILQLSGRYGSHEAAQPYRKRQTQGKGKDKQGQWHEVGGGEGGEWRESEREEQTELVGFSSGCGRISSPSFHYASCIARPLSAAR